MDTNQASLHSTSLEFLAKLKQSNFKGDIEDSYGARIVASTDNSVYQVIPQAIIYPRVADDINCLVSLLAEYVSTQNQLEIKTKLSIVARGGGTGTNGQSLNESLILDTSRYLNKIIELDEKTMQVAVEPGVVLDQLNHYLATYGLFFPPDVSSSSRATLGGMVATDASGKGSRVYGKTSDYIKSLDVVLSDGSDFQITTKKPPNDKKCKNWGGCQLANEAQKKVFELISDNQDEITKIFPRMNRGLTGYNLEHVLNEKNDKQEFNLAYLLAGSEGTLALTKKITLRVIKKPKYRALVAVLYDDFDKTLEHVAHLLKAEPTAIEVLDDKILQIAQQDNIWQDVKASFKGINLGDSIKGLNFVEVTANSKHDIETQCDVISKIIKETAQEHGVITHLIETDPKIISSLWSIRKRSVGLLAALEGDRRAIAFVEDSAVPPEHLPAFIKDFRHILDSHGLAYGMYGHADVGCLHVRPTLNMKQENDQKLLRTITDQVAQLAKKYGGLLWGEHGRGYRGEYSPMFFGEQLYPLLGEIKAVFDPQSIFNPGKLAVPTDNSTINTLNKKRDTSSVTAIDEVSFRGQFDTQVSDNTANDFSTAMLCNGNAACFSWDVSEAMCPSYKATGDKRQSPKGRASMLREWLRLSSETASKTTPNNTALLESLEHELYQSLNSCLSCKSCTHSCPIKVDIPELKSKFLDHYHRKNKRKFSDTVFYAFERFARVGRLFPTFVNVLLQNPLTKQLLENIIGVVDSPKFSSSLKAQLKQRKASFLDQESIERLTLESNLNTVILLPDTFNASYNNDVILACYDLLSTLGYTVLIAPIINNGKALHVKGYQKAFKKEALTHTLQMEKLGSLNLPLLSVDIVTRLMHSKEYPEILNTKLYYQVLSVEEWLNKELLNSKSLGEKITSLLTSNPHLSSPTLFPHCMEQTADKLSASYWQSIFAFFQTPLTIENAGCCGMSGLFGHEKANQNLSKKIYDQSWGNKKTDDKTVLASGFSCRCQLQNHGKAAQHPIQILAQAIKGNHGN